MRNLTISLFKVISLSLLASMAFAKSNRAPLDKVIFQVAAEQWVQSKEARVVISVNATLKDNNLAKMRAGLLNKINQIAKADWYITRFDRRQDRSGLENVIINAEARIASAKLTGLRAQAKRLSRSGESYRISSIDFSPSLVATEQVREQVRNTLYQKVNAEVKRLNLIYPKQQYTVYRINFLPRSYTRNARTNKSMAMFKAAASSDALSVSQKVRLSAIVSIAANRAQNKSSTNSQ